MSNPAGVAQTNHTPLLVTAREPRGDPEAIEVAEDAALIRAVIAARLLGGVH